jgi:outer membrane lipoprotein carrier protein
MGPAFVRLTTGIVATAAVVGGLWLTSGSLDAARHIAQPPAPTELAATLQRRYATIRDFRADFVQTVRSGVLKTIANSQRGDVRIKKPGRMRWTYQAPDRQVFVSDSVRMYFYLPADRTVHVSPMPTGSDISAAVLFLTGRGDLQRDFTATMPASHPDGEWHLMLTPRAAQDEFTSLTLAVDRESLVFKGFSWIDPGGTENTMRFSNLRENVGLKDSEFTFTIPEGARVMSSGGGRRP